MQTQTSTVRSVQRAAPAGGSSGKLDDTDFDAVYAETLRYFPDLVRELGGSWEALVQGVGVDPFDISNLNLHVGYRFIANLLERAASELSCPDFGMRLAMLQGGGRVFGPIGVVMRNSATFGDGVKYVADHIYAHSLAARIRIETDRTRQKFFCSHEILLDRLPNKRQLIEQVLLLGHLNAVQITGGQARAREVSFRFQPLSRLGIYRRYFGCPVRFDRPEDGIMFFDRDMDSPTVEPDTQLYESTTSYIDANFTRICQPIQTQVRAAILELMGREDCSAARVAAKLCTHPRTLNRRLLAAGTSYAKVRDQVRQDMALSYLKETALPLQRIADKLGYAEQSVFTRSCARWFSASPSAVRAQTTRQRCAD